MTAEINEMKGLKDYIQDSKVADTMPVFDRAFDGNPYDAGQIVADLEEHYNTRVVENEDHNLSDRSLVLIEMYHLQAPNPYYTFEISPQSGPRAILADLEAGLKNHPEFTRHGRP